MPLPIEERLKFFVFIVESPSAVDLYHGRYEGAMLQQSLKLNGLACESKLAANKDAFIAALRFGVREAMDVHKDLSPIVHISAHGDDEGLQFTDGSKMDWAELKTYLQPINKALNHGLIVCMSCCKGYSGIRMAMSQEDEEYPFVGIVGNFEKPTWAETSIAFSTFYHWVNKGELVYDAISAMNSAAGVTSFVAARADSTRTEFREYCSKTALQAARVSLEDEVGSTASSEVSKFADRNDLPSAI